MTDGRPRPTPPTGDVGGWASERLAEFSATMRYVTNAQIEVDDDLRAANRPSSPFIGPPTAGAK
jgi:hypothetical protein